MVKIAMEVEDKETIMEKGEKEVVVLPLFGQ